MQLDRKMFDMSDFYRENRCGSDICNERPSENRPEAGKQCKDPLTMVFINMQPLENVYAQSDAFKNGTLFPNLNKPFLGGKAG